MAHQHHTVAGRGIDHLVLAARSLDQMASFYQKLGFTVTPRAQHPWGTANRIVQLQGSFLELLNVADRESLFPHTDRQFSFGTFLKDYLDHREGFAMLVFESRDAHADRDQFAERGLPDLDVFDFGRDAVLPDGRQVRVAFSLAFAPPPETPEAVFFTCQQHAPEHFWKSEYQTHPNTALSIEEAVMVAQTPHMMRPILEKLQTPEAIFEEGAGLRCDTERGSIRIMTPQEHQDWYGEASRPNAPDGPYFSACRIGVQDLGITRKLLAQAGVETKWARSGLVVPSSQACGCTIAFAQGS